MQHICGRRMCVEAWRKVLSLRSDAAGSSRLSTQQRCDCSNMDGESKVSPFCFLIPVTHTLLPSLGSFSPPPCAFCLPGLGMLQSPRSRLTNGHSPSSSKSSPMCACASASFFPPSILMS